VFGTLLRFCTALLLNSVTGRQIDSTNRHDHAAAYCQHGSLHRLWRHGLPMLSEHLKDAAFGPKAFDPLSLKVISDISGTVWFCLVNMANDEMAEVSQNRPVT